jgi:hypothetical protein
MVLESRSSIPESRGSNFELPKSSSSAITFFFSVLRKHPGGSDPNRVFLCQRGSLGSCSSSGSHNSTIRKKIGGSARIVVIWVLITPLNRKPRRLTRRSRAKPPQSCSLFNGFSRKETIGASLRFNQKLNYP